MRRVRISALFGGIFLSVILSLNVTVFAGTTNETGTNLIKNPGFEDSTGDAISNWNVRDPIEGVTCEAVNKEAHSGKNSLKIINEKPHDTFLIQDITIEPDKVYKAAYWIKVDNVKNAPGSPNCTMYYVTNGAGCKGIYTGKEWNDTGKDWSYEEFYFKTVKDLNMPLTFSLRFGGQGTDNEGVVYFDDVVVEKVDNPPSGAYMNQFYIPENAPASSTTNSPVKSNNFKTPLLILLGVLVVGLIVFIEIKFTKRKNNENDPEDVEEAEEAEEGEDSEDLEDAEDAEDAEGKDAVDESDKEDDK